MLVPISPFALADTVTDPTRIPVSRPAESIYALPTVSSTVHVNASPGTSFPFTSRWMALNWMVLALATVGLFSVSGMINICTATYGIIVIVIVWDIPYAMAVTVTVPAKRPVNRPFEVIVAVPVPF